VDLQCGVYKDYYSSGTIQTRGEYNSKGQKHGRWYYYNEQGLFYKTEFYWDGKLEQ
jgi:antitoxin component YwqK of YwqJK toxin-antitoxin module